MANNKTRKRNPKPIWANRRAVRPDGKSVTVSSAATCITGVAIGMGVGEGMAVAVGVGDGVGTSSLSDSASLAGGAVP